jgi:hypothetical protein
MSRNAVDRERDEVLGGNANDQLLDAALQVLGRLAEPRAQVAA